RGKTLDEMQIALPTSAEDDDDLVQKLDEFVTNVANAVKKSKWNKRSVPFIQLLPEYVRMEDFMAQATVSEAKVAPSRTLRLPLGIEDLSLQPIALELNADTPHA